LGLGQRAVELAQDLKMEMQAAPALLPRGGELFVCLWLGFEST
jgi:hypothetical protein